MTKKKDSKVDQDNLSELEEVQDSIEQPEEESDLEEEVEPSAEEKISSLEDQMMRLQAEMINTRKSAQNDIARARIFGLESFMKDLLSVIDNLFRNLDFKTEENTIPADGYELILRELENVLGKNGIERIIELDLNESERALLSESAEAVRNVMSVLDNMNVNA